MFDVVVPYRNSVLTKLLKNALGGNSKTIMVGLSVFIAVAYSPTSLCSVSPGMNSVYGLIINHVIV